jgi:hypothetical protein
LEIKKIQLYTDLHYQADTREHTLVPMVRAYFNYLNEEERDKKYHRQITYFKVTQNMDEADWFILPSVWNAYVSNGTQQKALEFSRIAQSKKKLVVVWAGGDPEWIVPIPNGIQVQEGLHRLLPRQVKYAFERPSFVIDYVHEFYNDQWSPLPKQEKPTIGFCGMASSSFITKTLYYLRNLITTIKYSLNQSPVVPAKHGYPVKLRARTLDLLQACQGVRTDFIIRDRYQAGLRSKDNEVRLHDRSRTEFVQNILSNAYMVCVRGGGNFSRRFYETLACGRIPILVSTDSMLPFEEVIDWKQHIVWVDYQNLDQIGEIVEDFHANLSLEAFQELQIMNRRLWSDMLSAEGYYSNFHRYLAITSSGYAQ